MPTLTSTPSPDDAPASPTLPALRADCGSCTALCCVALPTTASAEFGEDRAAGVPCRHLRDDDRCELHDLLRARGWRGCAVFDCFGAGQRVTGLLRIEVADGTTDPPTASWRGLDAAARHRLFAAFGTLRRLHETAYHLETTMATAGSDLSRGLRHRLLERLREVAAAIDRSLDRLATDDPAPLQRDAGAALSAASLELRSRRRAAGERPRRLPRGVGPGADLVGRRLAGADLRTADLRSALLMATDLRDADLRWADLLGADLRDADLRGADLRGALFVSAPQLEASRGNAATRLPDRLRPPGHWR